MACAKTLWWGQKGKPPGPDHKEEKQMGLECRAHTLQGFVGFIEDFSFQSGNNGKPLKDFKQEGNMIICFRESGIFLEASPRSPASVSHDSGRAEAGLQ